MLFRRLLVAALFLEMGLLLVPLPWSGFWERNYFFDLVPTLQSLAFDNRIRGGISGLGVVNLLAAGTELVALVRRGLS